MILLVSTLKFYWLLTIKVYAFFLSHDIRYEYLKISDEDARIDWILILWKEYRLIFRQNLKLPSSRSQNWLSDLKINSAMRKNILKAVFWLIQKECVLENEEMKIFWRQTWKMTFERCSRSKISKYKFEYFKFDRLCTVWSIDRVQSHCSLAPSDSEILALIWRL